MLRASIIVPVYNREQSIGNSVESLLAQTISPDEYEILLVNDGSTDASLSVCRRYAKEHANIVVINKENGGVGSARNAGLDIAKGRYIGFLDSDDVLSPNSLEKILALFEQNDDAVDLVTYSMIVYRNGKKSHHVRDKVFRETGIFDLTSLQYAYAPVTSINVFVKNSDKLPRFRNNMRIHEDTFFAQSILMDKQRVGFCKEAVYHYYQNDDSSVNNYMHPYYIFEQNISFWEELFNQFETEVPLFLQATYLNELSWKLKADLVYPYHYSAEQFDDSLGRIRKLLSSVDESTIAFFPRLSSELKMHIMSLRNEPNYDLKFGLDGAVICANNAIMATVPNILINFTRIRCEGNNVHFVGNLRSPLFGVIDKPTLCLEAKGKRGSHIANEHFEVELFDSAFSRFQAKFKTAQYWGFDFWVNLESVTSVRFYMEPVSHGKGYPAFRLKPTFHYKSGFDWSSQLLSTISGCWIVAVDVRNTEFVFERASKLEQRKRLRLNLTCLRKNISKKKRVIYPFKVMLLLMKDAVLSRGPIWLYYDRAGVGKDNSYYQFIHDCAIQDGVQRYFVSSMRKKDLSSLFSKKQLRRVIDFYSLKHRCYHLLASKIIASYIEHSNICPFNMDNMKYFADIFDPEIIYLQHGILHAHMPWKWSFERIGIDREVVSTRYEISNLIRNYNFRNNEIIPCGMPRYDHMSSSDESKKAILFAPSWRKYLVNQDKNLVFTGKDKQFETSVFWNEVKSFLSSKELSELLRQTGYHLDIKLHPIFSCYADWFRVFECDSVRLKECICPADYRILITDYSSMVFDYVYMKRSIMYFLPDIGEFNSGLNGYRKLDLPIEDGFGPLATTAESALCCLQSLIAELEKDTSNVQSCEREKQANDCWNDFFLFDDDCQCDRLYRAIESTSDVQPINS